MKNWTIEDWQREIERNSRDKGWLEDLPTNGDERALARWASAELMNLVSEISEAQEDLRNGHWGVRINSQTGKPEGLPTEFADIVSRAMCIAAALNISMIDSLIEKHSYNLGRAHRHGGKLL